MKKNNDRTYLIIIAVLSVAVPLLVSFLLFKPQTGKLGDVDVTFLPKLHALLNSLTALALLTGYYFVRNKNIRGHRFAMVTAFVLSAFFLISYVTYHYQAAPTRFGGEGTLKLVYYVILITHIVLAAVIVPLVLLSIYFAVSEQIPRHRRIARWTFPIWLYVAVTGVVVYFMIAPYYPG
ncbi:MAG: Terminal oxidase biogenesis protein CtaM, putative heme A, heme O chaperone [uncultured Adhaeribacter sp.]|uniref:Terminal oxidase biogenesis protein CtaM, putative heme A, heme O chaperone n=1 Tax=uncultured Adhaeribacter sp. TaxID=448109 RepID=A0A6J4IKR2_9BACT|nr:MAG: Terminal oxidase biogenesis protein CtaM, putative heme A, heme O chaperone [uncultured Adhaeribacter sp.]